MQYCANRELVERFFTAISAKDESALALVVRPDVEWSMMLSDQATRLEANGIAEAVAKFLNAGAGVFAPGDPKSRILGVVCEENRAMAETAGSGHRIDGKVYESRYAWAFEFDEGRIARIREYTDTAYAFRFFDLSGE